MIPANRAQLVYWNGPIGHLWAGAQEKRDRDHAPMTEAVLKLAAAAPGERVLDIGCGSGTTTLRLAQSVEPDGSAVGIDLSGPMLAVARQRAQALGSRAQFIDADVTDYAFERKHLDLAFSQFGVMFFADPVASFTNVFAAMKEGGRLAFVCWRASTENPWSAVPESAAKPLLPPMEPVPPDAPGRYSFASPDRVKSILLRAGFHAPQIEKFDAMIHLGDTPEAAASSSIDAGPLARTLAEADDDTRQRVREAVIARLAREMGPGGISLAAGCWLVAAKA
jgi:ubiquinone/menaquinone biosynthesis C-methylase UbiE